HHLAPARERWRQAARDPRGGKEEALLLPGSGREDVPGRRSVRGGVEGDAGGRLRVSQEPSGRGSAGISEGQLHLELPEDPQPGRVATESGGHTGTRGDRNGRRTLAAPGLSGSAPRLLEAQPV